MYFLTWIHRFVWLLPIAGLTIAIQSIAAWFYPDSLLGQEFLNSIETVFTMEFVMMHSTIFWYSRDMVKEKTGRIALGVFLTLAYSLFMIPLVQKSPWLALNYVAYCAARLFLPEPTPWFRKAGFLKSYKDPKLDAFILMMLALLKAACFGLFLTIVAETVPLPPGHSLAKVLSIYFTGTVLFDTCLYLYIKLKKTAY